jgi:hypothetical protein
MVEIVIKHNLMVKHPVEASIPQGSLVCPNVFTIFWSGLITWDQTNVSRVQGLFFIDNVG